MGTTEQLESQKKFWKQFEHTFKQGIVDELSKLCGKHVYSVVYTTWVVSVHSYNQMLPMHY